MGTMIWKMRGQNGEPMEYIMGLVEDKDMDEYQKQRITGIPTYFSEDGRFWPFIDLPIEKTTA